MSRTKLTEQEIKKFADEINMSIKFREDEFGTYDVDNPTGNGLHYALYDNWDHYRGGSNESNTDTFKRTEVIFNEVKPTTKQFLASTYYQNPKITFKSTRKNDDLYAPVMENVINYLYRELGVKEQNEFVIFNAFMSDMGCSEVGYFSDKVRIPEEREKAVKRTVGEKIKGLFKPGEPIDYNEYIRYETPFIQSVWPFHQLFPFYAHEIRNMPWGGKQMIKDMNFIHNAWSSTKSLKGFDMVSKGIKRKDNLSGTNIENFKQMYVYWLFLKPGSMDGIEELHSLVYLGNESGVTEKHPVHFGPCSLPIEGLPLIYLQFNKTQGKIYNVSEVGTIAGKQHKLNVLVSRIYDLARKYNFKILYNIDNFKGVGMLDKLRDNSDIFVGVKGGAGTPTMAISEPKETSRIPQEILQVVQLYITQIRVEFGITESALTGESEAEFATTEKIGAGGMAVRLNKSADRINDYMIEQARKFTQIVRKFYPYEKVEKIIGDGDIDLRTGQSKPIEWRDFEEHWVKGEYDISIDVGSMQKPNPEKDLKYTVEWANFLKDPVTSQLLALENKRIKMSKVVEILGKQFNQRTEDFVEDMPEGQGTAMEEAGAGGGGEALAPMEANPEEVLGEGMGV